MSKSSESEPLPAVKALLAQWDRSSNPLFLWAAGQLRVALRTDGRAMNECDES